MAIQIRRGTDAQWESTKSNIVAGEPAVALDTGRVFVGTGTGTFVELADETTVSALDADINATTTGLKDRMTAAEGDITTIEGTISGLGDASELDYDVVSSSPTTIIQLKDGNTDVYPVGVSSLDYDVISTTDDSVVLADYVVEQGTSTVSGVTWTYRKWNSGKAECWCTAWYYNLTINRQYGAVYLPAADNEQGNINFPFTFTARPVITKSVDGGNQWILGSSDVTTTNTGTFWICRAATGTNVTVGVSIYAIGTWK